MSEVIIACLGGFCGQREKCAHYFSDGDIRSERLCGLEWEEVVPINPRKEEVKTAKKLGFKE